MPVGTRGTVKGLFPGHVHSIGAQIVLGNTYHLLLRPGDEIVRQLGGLHRFMNWHGPILTDSGGYQAYSMADINKVNDDGVTFKSIVDGSLVMLNPERAMQIQNNLGADIIMAFDDCPPSVDPNLDIVNQTRLRQAVARDARALQEEGNSPHSESGATRRPHSGSGATQSGATQSGATQSGATQGREFAHPRLPKGYDHTKRLQVANERTVRWLERCKAAHARSGDQALFGIIQGGTDLAARDWSRERVCGVDLPGYAIGGVAVGERSDEIARVVRHTAPRMPANKPRYLMGVGYERDLAAAVIAGVDMFDCVLPTRNGRNANAFTPSGQIRLRNAKFTLDSGPIEVGCDCPACLPGAMEMYAGGAGIPNIPPAAGFGGSDSWFSRAYIRHLFFAGEMLGPILVSLHNLRYFQRFMRDLRSTVVSDDWVGFVGRWPVAAPGVPAELLGNPVSS